MGQVFLENLPELPSTWGQTANALEKKLKHPIILKKKKHSNLLSTKQFTNTFLFFYFLFFQTHDTEIFMHLVSHLNSNINTNTMEPLITHIALNS